MRALDSASPTAGRWSARQIALAAFVGLTFVALHFHGLFAAGFGKVIWGISDSADPVGVISGAYDFVQRLVNACGDKSSAVSYPFGETLPLDLQPYTSFAMAAFTWLAALTDRYVWSYNVAIVAMFVLNYAVTLVCIRSLTRSFTAGLVAATLYTFSAYAYAHSWAHLGLMFLWGFPLFIYAFYRLQETRALRYAVLAALAFGLNLHATPYYAYFCVWIGLAIVAARVMAEGRAYFRPRTLGAQGLFVALAALLALPIVYISFWQNGSELWQPLAGAAHYGRSRFIFTSSARPLDYVQPNVLNWLFGDWSKSLVDAYANRPTRDAQGHDVIDVVRARFTGSDEYPIAIGILPTLFLAWLLVAGAWRQLMRRRAADWALYATLALTMLVAFLISLPPHLFVFGHKLYLPNELFADLVPFRSYSRFAAIFLLALATWLGLAIDRAGRWRPALTVLVLGACLFEMMPVTKLHPADENAAYYKFLRERPEQVIARFDVQSMYQKRAVDLERVLTRKPTINGSVNSAFKFTDRLFKSGAVTVELMQSLGAGLFVTTSPEAVTLDPADPSAESYGMVPLAYFPEEQAQVWKLEPGAVPPSVAAIIERRSEDRCYVVRKADVIATAKGLLQAL